MKNKLIWIDVGTPKYALFFSKMIPHLENRGFDIFVTTRYSEHYTEAKEILDINGIENHVLGNYGGSSLEEKFLARLSRQQEIVKLINTISTPMMLITGAVVDSVQVAYGLGIPVINIYDTPVATFPNSPFDYKNLTAVSRLTLPYSTLFFYPFVLPKEMFDGLGLYDKQIIPYNFIDVCLWMDQIKVNEKNDFRVKYGLDITKPTIMIREEEYKAHYVKEQIPVLYDLIYRLKDFDVNLVIMPRYEKERLKDDFGSFATVLEDKLKSDEFYPFIDLFIGGGGTMNLESVYYGIPTISTRSIWLYHDKYLVENGLMHWTDDCDEALSLVKRLLGTRVDAKKYFCKDKCSFEVIIDKIENYFNGVNMIDLENDDFKIFKEIEKVRVDIILQNKSISITDFGAGSPESSRTKEEMYQGNKVQTSTKDMCKIGLKDTWAQLMYKMVKTYKPKQILELGTCCGFSSIYMSKANPQSKITTIEGSIELAKIAQQNRKLLNCNNVTQKIGRFQDVLVTILNELKKVDFVFIDGHHDKDATVEYYNKIKPYLSNNAIVIFDDISWSDGMKEAWQIILKDTTIKKYEDLGKLGVCYY